MPTRELPLGDAADLVFELATCLLALTRAIDGRRLTAAQQLAMHDAERALARFDAWCDAAAPEDGQ